jgi:3-oxoacyl-[acyl-carrier-protein] synthase-3
MASQAAKIALQRSGLSASDIELIIVASTTPDATFPSTASFVQHAIGCKPIPAFDLQAVCAGFVYGISVAEGLALNCNYQNVMVIGVERMSQIIDWQDRNTCVLFGDGAAACIFQPCATNPLKSSITYCDGTLRDILHTQGGATQKDLPYGIAMQGKDVFKQGVTKMSAVALELLNKNNLCAQDIAYFVPHQANVRIINAIVEKMGIAENKVVKTVEKHANCSAASIPLALDHLFNNVKPQANQLILTVGFGAGLTWGANLLLC